MKWNVVWGVVLLGGVAWGQPEGGLVRPEFAQDQAGRPHYDLDVVLDDTAGTLTGRLTLTWTHLGDEPLAALPLRLAPNTAQALGASPSQAGSLTIDRVQTQSGPAVTLDRHRADLVWLLLERPLASGETLTVEVRYAGRLGRLPSSVNDALQQGVSGLNSDPAADVPDYGLLAQGDGILTLASAYPFVPPPHDGGFDTRRPARHGDLVHNVPARFDLRLLVPPGLTVVTNLVDDPPTDGPRGTSLIRARGDLVRDLVLTAGRDLTVEIRRVGATTVRSWFRPRDRRAGELALEAAADSLACFEDLFGPYPYTELDVAEASLKGGAGGVEFCGMVLIAGTLYRDPSTSRSPAALYLRALENLGDLGGGRRNEPSTLDPGLLDDPLEFTVAHEVAHQYFAGLVGNDCHDEPTLDEPLAQYAAALAYAQRHQVDVTEPLAQFALVNFALYRALGGPDRPAARPTRRFGSSLEYAALVYGKAPYLYVDLARQVGPDTLHRAIRAAVTDSRFQTVPLARWFDLLAQHGVPTAPAAAQRWLHGTSGDVDLDLRDPAQHVFRLMFDANTARDVTQFLEQLGLEPRDFLHMIFGELDTTQPGPTLDPDALLDDLDDPDPTPHPRDF